MVKVLNNHIDFHVHRDSEKYEINNFKFKLAAGHYNLKWYVLYNVYFKIIRSHLIICTSSLYLTRNFKWVKITNIRSILYQTSQ